MTKSQSINRESIVRTLTEHNLPIRQLSPLQFEELCAALLEASDYGEVDHTGAGGSDAGCDLIATDTRGQRTIAQCKRVGRLRASDALREIDKILALPSAERPDLYLLIAPCAFSLMTRRRIAERIDGAFTCKLWGLSELDRRIRDYPAIVERFFGPLSVPQPERLRSVRGSQFRGIAAALLIGLVGLGSCLVIIDKAKNGRITVELPTRNEVQSVLPVAGEKETAVSDPQDGTFRLEVFLQDARNGGPARIVVNGSTFPRVTVEPDGKIVIEPPTQLRASGTLEIRVDKDGEVFVGTVSGVEAAEVVQVKLERRQGALGSVPRTVVSESRPKTAGPPHRRQHSKEKQAVSAAPSPSENWQRSGEAERRQVESADLEVIIGRETVRSAAEAAQVRLSYRVIVHNHGPAKAQQVELRSRSLTRTFEPQVWTCVDETIACHPLEGRFTGDDSALVFLDLAEGQAAAIVISGLVSFETEALPVMASVALPSELDDPNQANNHLEVDLLAPETAAAFPVCLGFWAEPSSVRPGEPSFLAFEVENAIGASLEGNPVALGRVVEVRPEHTTQYVLEVEGSPGSPKAFCFTTVEVSLPPCDFELEVEATPRAGFAPLEVALRVHKRDIQGTCVGLTTYRWNFNAHEDDTWDSAQSSPKRVFDRSATVMVEVSWQSNEGKTTRRGTAYVQVN